MATVVSATALVLLRSTLLKGCVELKVSRLFGFVNQQGQGGVKPPSIKQTSK